MEFYLKNLFLWFNNWVATKIVVLRLRQVNVQIVINYTISILFRNASLMRDNIVKKTVVFQSSNNLLVITEKSLNSKILYPVLM